MMQLMKVEGCNPFILQRDDVVSQFRIQYGKCHNNKITRIDFKKIRRFNSSDMKYCICDTHLLSQIGSNSREELDHVQLSSLCAIYDMKGENA